MTMHIRLLAEFHTTNIAHIPENSRGMLATQFDARHSHLALMTIMSLLNKTRARV